MEADAELKRLRWRCTRRATHFSGLTPEQAAAFVVLADMEDLELWPLITGKRECANSLQAEVVSMLRDVRVKYSSGNAPTSGQA